MKPTSETLSLKLKAMQEKARRDQAALLQKQKEEEKRLQAEIKEAKKAQEEEAKKAQEAKEIKELFSSADDESEEESQLGEKERTVLRVVQQCLKEEGGNDVFADRLENVLKIYRKRRKLVKPRQKNKSRLYIKSVSVRNDTSNPRVEIYIPAKIKKRLQVPKRYIGVPVSKTRNGNNKEFVDFVQQRLDDSYNNLSLEQRAEEVDFGFEQMRNGSVTKHPIAQNIVDAWNDYDAEDAGGIHDLVTDSDDETSAEGKSAEEKSADQKSAEDEESADDNQKRDEADEEENEKAKQMENLEAAINSNPAE